jgi:hypothetical protein
LCCCPFPLFGFTDTASLVNTWFTHNPNCVLNQRQF